MKKMKKIIFLLLMILPFTLTYKVKADSILDVENIKQIQNSSNVNFRVINNYEVGAIYEDLGDTLEFEVKLKNKSSDQNVKIKKLVILTEDDSVDYTASLDVDNLEVKPGETRILRVKGVLNSKAINSEKIIRLQLHYSVSDKPCPDCNKPIDVDVNPKTGDNIATKFIILGLSLFGLGLVVIYLSLKNKNVKSLLILLVLSICLTPLYTVKADTDYMLEIIIHQTIRIRKIDDTITATEVVEPYTGDPIEGIFEDISGTPITPIYYDDDTCQNPIQGKPVNAGVYYATATSEGNNWYNPGELECTKVVTIEKIPSTCPLIEDTTATYDGLPHSLLVLGDPVGGTLYYSLDNINWTNNNIQITEAGIHNIYTKVVGDRNHEDASCGTHTVTINKKVLTVKASDQSKVYDGTPLEADSTCEIVGETYGTTVTCVNAGSIENVGEADKVVRSVIVTLDGVDVSNNFEIEPEKGTLRIEPARSAVAGTCIDPTYNATTQNLIEGGYLVEYTDNLGLNAGNYSVTVTAANNYAFEDGTTVKTITCKVLKRGVTITPQEQDIKYGEEISKQLSDVVITNLVEGHTLNSISLNQDGTEVTSNGKIIASNAVIFDENGENNNSNYEVTYNDGRLKIYYDSRFINDTHCKTPTPASKKNYDHNLLLPSIEPNIGYSAEAWYIDNSRVGVPDETIIIDDSYTYTAKCIDDIAPTLITLDVIPEEDDFTIKVKAQDLGSGTTKIEWFYKKCGSENYTQLTDTTFEPTNDIVEKTKQTGVCLSYGRYYAYVKITDEAGNVRTSPNTTFTVLEPGTDKVSVDSSEVGTSCKTLECSLNQLLEYFK